MASSAPRVQPGSFLTLHYRLAGPAGDIINTFEGQALDADAGHRRAVARRGAAPAGPGRGRARHFEIPAGEAFGDRNPDMVQWVARKLLVQMGDPMRNTRGRRRAVPHAGRPGPVRRRGAAAGRGRDGDGKPDAVLFDFNHPLAGQPVTFEVHVIGVL
jgi:FKBP-type peptidyl-prolyl cis-trans isomerase SlpA